MSRLIDSKDLTSKEALACGWRATSILRLCIRVAENLPSDGNEAMIVGDDIANALSAANELVDAMHWRLSAHEDSEGGAA